jgi:imidazolonepropionase-like amidohydrolase
MQVAIEAGLDFITHGDMSMPPDTIPEETLQELVRRGIGSSVLPYTQRRLDALEKYAPASAALYRSGKNNRRNMIRAGVTMLLSTDSYINEPDLLPEPIPLVADTVDPDRKIGEAQLNALVALEEEGMDRMTILKTATSNIAKAYRVDDKLGTIAPGKIADLVILAADPLANAKNYRRIDTVIQEGRIVDRDALPVAPVFTKRVGRN